MINHQMKKGDGHLEPGSLFVKRSIQTFQSICPVTRALDSPLINLNGYISLSHFAGTCSRIVSKQAVEHSLLLEDSFNNSALKKPHAAFKGIWIDRIRNPRIRSIPVLIQSEYLLACVRCVPQEQSTHCDAHSRHKGLRRKIMSQPIDSKVITELLAPDIRACLNLLPSNSFTIE
jgi:hypothetical protein